jgi:hypothetical protein
MQKRLRELLSVLDAARLKIVELDLLLKAFEGN